MPTSKLAKRLWFLLFFVIAAFYFFGLGSLPLVGPDEPRYAEIAREMLARRDLITPRLGGIPWFEKPPLLYWLMMASYRVFGVSEFSARLGPALCGLGTGAFVWWTAKNISVASGADAASPSQLTPAKEFREFPCWSALVFLSSLGAIAFSRAASFDIVLTITITGALSCILVWHVRTLESADDKRGRRLLLAFYFFVGMSLLAKGLLGIVLPFGILAAFFVLRWERPQTAFWKSLLWGIPLALAVASLWYGPMVYRHRWQFVDQFIIQHHFARFLTNKYHHPQPFYFYLPVLAVFVFPWTIVLIETVASSRKWTWRGPTPIDRIRLFLVLWIAVPLVFFSFSESKIPGYLLPVLPAAAVLVGERLRSFLGEDRGSLVLRLSGAVLLTVATAAAWYAVKGLGVSLYWTAAAFAIPFVFGAISLVFSGRQRPMWLMIALAPLVLCAVALRPAASLAGQDSVRDMMHEAGTRGYGSMPVFFMLSDDRTAEFYAGGRLVYQPNGEPYRFDGAQDLAAAIRQRGGSALVLIETRWEKQLTSYSAVGTERIANNKSLTMFVVHTR